MVEPATGRADLLALSDHVWGRTRARLDGLGDEEAHWEPARPAWTVRAGSDGSVVADWEMEPDPVPVPTIAWRLWHLTVVYGAPHNETFLTGTEPADAADHAWVLGRCAPQLGTVDALGGLVHAHGWWRTLLGRLDDRDLGRPMGAAAGPFAESTRRSFALHVLDEAIHHAAEVALRRDLWRARSV